MHHQPPTHVYNRFSPLSNAPAEKLVERALVIGESILRNVKIVTPTAILNCISGARAADIEANLKVLAKGKTKSKFSRIIIHVGANDVRMRQSEITKLTSKSVCTLAKQTSQSVTFSVPTPMRRGDVIYSRLTSLNRWLSEWCPSNNVGYINNWHDFRGRPGLLKRDGIHPTWEGAALLSRNLVNSLKHCWLTRAEARQQFIYPTQIPALSLEPPLMLNSINPIETVSVPRISIPKRSIRGICPNNLIKINLGKENICKKMVLKIVLLNIRSLTHKAALVNELTWLRILPEINYVLCTCPGLHLPPYSDVTEKVLLYKIQLIPINYLRNFFLFLHRWPRKQVLSSLGRWRFVLEKGPWAS